MNAFHRYRSGTCGRWRAEVRYGFVRVATLLTLAPSLLAAQEAARSPHGTLPEALDCAACHTSEGWTRLRDPLGFRHGDGGGFELTGAHAITACAGCHFGLRFDEPSVAPDDCVSCHLDIHEGRMVEGCIACHRTTSFLDVDGDDVHARTSFPLMGAHRQINCESCHVDDVGGAFSSLDTDCVSCHVEAYEDAATIDHVQSGYPTDCTECHSSLAWGDAPTFDHATAANGFVLLGAHAQLRCASCHAIPGMAPLFDPSGPEDCLSCHQADYDHEHGGSNFPTDCLSCHTQDTWEGAEFDHALVGFEFVGKHAELGCSQCHTEGQQGLRFPTPADANDCVACHQADYDEEHGGSGFPTTCLSCHNQNSWDAEGGLFDHNATGFLLTGAHADALCASCHGPPVNHALAVADPDDCAACHDADYQTEHAGSGYPLGCALCHTSDAWEGGTADHAVFGGGYVLDGPHAEAACTVCHTEGAEALLFPEPTDGDDCVACHQADYDAEHQGTGFPTECLGCHARDVWTGATVDHVSFNGAFELVGRHATAACSACHAAGFTLLFPPPTSGNDCVACHQAEWDAEHGVSGFNTECFVCHTSEGWLPSTFDHDAQYFRVYSGTHQQAWNDCADCHESSPGYATFSCVNCHAHTRAQTDQDHSDVADYVYESSGCYSCHPSGDS